MNEIEKYFKLQRQNLMRHLENGYHDYAQKMYLLLIKTIEDEIQKNNQNKEFILQILLDISQELVNFSDLGLTDVQNYFFVESKVISNFIIFQKDPQIKDVWRARLSKIS